MQGRGILLIIAGGIAAYKSLELIRRLRERDVRVRCILTRAGAEFITPLAVASLAGEKVFSDLFSLTDEAEMGHIRLSREADLVVVAPATADLIAKMANGLADDLASTALLATDKPVLIAPAMNPQMWQHPATQRNLALLGADGIRLVGPNPGDMACGEIGVGRMAEPAEILAAIEALLTPAAGTLAGLRALVTSGPTVEAIDPVRFIANRSSGKQGHAIAAALRAAGAEVTLVSGPVQEPDPEGVAVVRVELAAAMLAACQAALPVERRGLRGGGRRLAGGRAVRPEAQAPAGPAADPGPGREPGHPEDARAGRPVATGAGGGLRRRDRERRGQRAPQVGSQGLRLDRREWRFDG